jgi:hypothetical protein
MLVTKHYFPHQRPHLLVSLMTFQVGFEMIVLANCKYPQRLVYNDFDTQNLSKLFVTKTTQNKVVGVVAK